MSYLRDIRPTKSELLVLKSRLKIAVRSYKTLQMKRDGLILEVTKLAPLVKAEYDLLMVRYRRVRHLLAPAYMIEGMLNVTIAAYSVESKTEIEVSEKNLFGIRVPVITGSNVRTDLVDRGYGLLGTSLVIDDMADAYEKLVDAIIAYAGNAAALNHLITEIERISRRVKALEHVVIPSLEASIATITASREELEREEQSRLFHVKKRWK
ncbi:V-type ATPase, D subunit [Methanospirillum hungatei JF-1]|uniref:A-type ATP synthase subunit D n=1 Tax=Methanospirillum hungatei JF-1 (strain ATCC 27890 / DSM 864 / NBRC 100397 / JF-1) TaxID=323259 RepID=Q2FU26_METHJ|nr:V-type ATP synthase subunit D [Methanospirillum hungatei]ABD42461.1 V-type ATPase, D subunit [Methanospirillum hungatei JF-1]